MAYGGGRFSVTRSYQVSTEPTTRISFSPKSNNVVCGPGYGTAGLAREGGEIEALRGSSSTTNQRVPDSDRDSH